MKISVLGAGAIGSMFGGLIQHHRPDLHVELIVRGEHGREIERAGKLQLLGPWGVHAVPIAASQEVARIADSDYVLFTVKSQATRETIKAASPYLGKAVLISIQNGINQTELCQFVTPGALVMGMTATNIAIPSPGSVSLQLSGVTILGAPGGAATANRVVEAAAELLRLSGLRVEAHPNVLGVQYNKLAINALGYASVLSASNFITEAILHGGWRKAVGIPILDECYAAFRAAGIQLAAIPGVPDVWYFRQLMRLLSVPGLRTVIAAVARSIFNRKPIVFSLQQDLLRGKTTEIDHINGEIVRLANEYHTPSGVNAQVVAMVHELERRGDATFFSRDEVIRRLTIGA